MSIRIRSLAVLWLLVMSTAVLFGRSDVIHFKGVLLRVESGASPKIVVRVATAELSLAVSSDTVIEASGNRHLTLADLSAGQFLELEVAFTTDGLFVKKIELEKDPENHFRVDGLIDAVEKVSDETKLTVIGIAFWLNAETSIHGVGRDAKNLTASDLKPGDRVDVQGVQEGSRLVARRLTIGFPKAEDHPIRFEGLIEKISTDGKTLDLKVGDAGRAVVHLTPETKVVGTPKVGLLAQVTGFLESDLSVTAVSVRVDANGNGKVDDDKDEKRPEPYRVEITLAPGSSSSAARGSASVMSNPSGETFSVKAEHLEKRVSYQIVVTSTGGAHTFSAESNGGGHLSFSAKSPWPSTLVSVKSFKKVEIVRLGVVVLSGTF
ncbi:MAG: DUF5666 domain-containing protein [Acidobacteriota bacterium]